MTSYNFDSDESNSDNLSNESNWNEAQWRNYLRLTEKDSARFLSYYNSIKDQPNHLDDVAVLMGWDGEDMSLIDDDLYSDEAEDNDLNDFKKFAIHSAQTSSVHCNKVFIQISQSKLEPLLTKSPNTSSKLCWEFAQSLHFGEYNIVLAIQAMDLGDYGLAVCHFKNSLNALNQSLSILNILESIDDQYTQAIIKEFRIRLFDLRELWIRVINDCRQESRRNSDKDIE